MKNRSWAIVLSLFALLMNETTVLADYWKVRLPPMACSQLNLKPGQNAAGTWVEHVQWPWWPKTGGNIMEGEWNAECAQVGRSRNSMAYLAVLQRNFNVIDAHCFVPSSTICHGPPAQIGIGNPVRR